MSRRPDEPVRLTKIYTRGGDAGQTSLGDGSRVSKLDPLVRAYGAVDELNSILGWAQVEARDPRLERIQNELFDLGADLSVPFAPEDGKLRVTQEAIDRLERDCDDAERAAVRAQELRAARRLRGGCAAAHRAGDLQARRARGAGRRRGARAEPARRSST